MSKVTFLEATQPLVKSYSLDSAGKLVKESYPRVWEFTSHTYDYETLQDLYDLMRGAAKQGWCLLKGDLQRPLVRESRAGSTDPNSLTRIICFDFDRLPPGCSIENALEMNGFAGYSYIVQYSASYGVEPEKGCTAHVFILLDRPVHPASLKQMLISLNLKVEALRAQAQLTSTHNALSWGLDVSTCQNDKLIYIAPPLLGAGVLSVFEGERIQLVTKASATLDPAVLKIPTAEENRLGMNALLDKLRGDKSLPKRSWAVKIDKETGLEVLNHPDASTMTGMKRERGFTYFNLNGGDSWGYYHPNDAPEVIRNFKGEGNYLTAELLPDYWATVQLERASHAVARAQVKTAMETGNIDASKPQVLVFRDFKSAIYYNGTWDPVTQHLSLAKANSETQLQHFLQQHGQPELDYIPVWDLVFDPHSEVRVDPAAKTLNTFEPSKYMKQQFEEVRNLDGCPVIKKLLGNAVARRTDLQDHYVNWFACIFRYRDRTMTAWALQGVQGTGKGLLINKVLIPLLGASNVVVKRMEELEDQFNGYAEQALLVVLDEAQISESKKSKMVMANLKNMITEPQVSVRKMYSAAYTVPNYCNFMFLSNQPDVVVIENADRRFNVGEYRTEKLVLTDTEIDSIEGELPAFANYLMTMLADRNMARTPLVTEERAEMIATSTTSIDATSQAILTGDLAFFWDALPAGAAGSLGPEQQTLYDAYTALVFAALSTENGVHRMTRDELRVLFAYNVGEVPRTPAKFTSLLRHHRISLIPMRIHGHAVTVRGFEITWRADASWLRERMTELQKKQPALRLVKQN
jgi:hypothetical protein